MSASKIYSIDALDFYDEFNYIVSSSTDDLLEMPARDEPFSYKWKDTGLTDYDLTNPTFQDRDITISGAIVANSKAEFWQKYIALRDVLFAPGARTLYSYELKQSFTIFYKSSPNPKKLTHLQNSPDLVVMKIDLVFRLIYTPLVLPPDKESQTITFAAIPYKFIDAADFTISPSASSGLPLTLTSSNPAVAIITGNLIHITGLGTTTITATQAGNGDYNAALPVAKILAVIDHDDIQNTFPYALPATLIT